MSVCIQLGQIAGENVVEVSGIKEVCGIYLEHADVAIAIECVAEAADKKIQLLFTPAGNKAFMPFSFIIPIMAQRLVLARLLDDSKLIIVPESIEEELNDTQAIIAYLQCHGGLWIDGLPKECIKEIVKHCAY